MEEIFVNQFLCAWFWALTEARAHERWARVDIIFGNLDQSESNFSYFIKFHFHSLDGQIDSNSVCREFNNRHFEINQYTNCD